MAYMSSMPQTVVGPDVRKLSVRGELAGFLAGNFCGAGVAVARKSLADSSDTFAGSV
jgi:hypothetical protein